MALGKKLRNLTQCGHSNVSISRGRVRWSSPRLSCLCQRDYTLQRWPKAVNLPITLVDSFTSDSETGRGKNAVRRIISLRGRLLGWARFEIYLAVNDPHDYLCPSVAVRNIKLFWPGTQIRRSAWHWQGKLKIRCLSGTPLTVAFTTRFHDLQATALLVIDDRQNWRSLFRDLLRLS